MHKHTNRGGAQPLLIIVVALVFAAAGYLAAQWRVATQSQPDAVPSALRQFPQPRVIADFALVDQHGQPYGLERWRGRWNLVFLGFTHCPDICPATLAILSQVRQLLQSAPAQADLPAIDFISVDPERDSPEHLARYVAHFDPTITAATGPDPQLAALARQLGIVYTVEPHQPDDRGYQVDHGANILLIDDEARLLGVFPPPHDAEAIADALQALLGGGR